MNKKNENNLLTSRALKNKHSLLEREKLKTIPMRKKSEKNGKLTDLCPDEKEKIGQLIKALQARRIENLQLRRENEKMRENICQCESKLDEIKNQSLEKEAQIDSLREMIVELNSTIHFYKQKIKEMIKASTKSPNSAAEIQTQYIKTEIASCQTLSAICKQLGSQTDHQKEQFNLLYQMHSKSFEKIMKNNLWRNAPRENVSSLQSASSEANSSNLKQSKDDFIAFERNMDDNCSETFQEIDQKWNLLKLKNQAEQNKSKGLYSVDASESSSPSKDGNSRDTQNLPTIDGIALNRILRKNDFSACKLMRAVNVAESKKDSHEVSYLKSPYFNRLEGEHSRLRPLTNQSHNISQNNPSFHLNFYESGLSDMGSSRR